MNAQQVRPSPAVMELEEWKRLSSEGLGSSQVGEQTIELGLHMVALSQLNDMERRIAPHVGGDRARVIAPDIALGLFDMGLKVIAGYVMNAEKFESPGSRYSEYETLARLALEAYTARYAPAAEAIRDGESPVVGLPDGAGAAITEGLAPLIRFLNSF